MQDNSEFQVVIKAPVGINLETMKAKIAPIDALLKEDHDIVYSISSIGYNSAKEIHKAKFYAKLKPVAERTRTQEQIIQFYRDKLKTYQDFTILVEKVDDFDTGGTNGHPYKSSLPEIASKSSIVLRVSWWTF